MIKNKIKLVHFIFGLFVIGFLGISWLGFKVFDKTYFFEIVWLMENAHSLKEYDEDIIRHSIQCAGLSFLASVLWYTLLYKRNQYIYI